MLSEISQREKTNIASYHLHVVTEKGNSETEYNNGCLGLQGGRIEKLANWYIFCFSMKWLRVNFMFFHHFF